MASRHRLETDRDPRGDRIRFPVGEAKDHARAALQADIRPLVRRLQASPNVDDGARAAMGITVPDRVPTPAGPPGTRPVVRVDISQRLRHTVHFADEATPKRRLRNASEITGSHFGRPTENAMISVLYQALPARSAEAPIAPLLACAVRSAGVVQTTLPGSSARLQVAL